MGDSRRFAVPLQMRVVILAERQMRLAFAVVSDLPFAPALPAKQPEQPADDERQAEDKPPVTGETFHNSISLITLR
jgi:hypothetical protein